MTTYSDLKSRLFLKGRLRQQLTDAAKSKLEGTLGEPELIADGTTICRRGEPCTRSTLLLEGFMLRTIEAEKGRHIVSIQVPGDFVDLHGFALKWLDHNLVSVGKACVAYAPHDALESIVHDMPGLTRVLWFSTLLDAAIHREWILKMEQLNADGRVAHLLAELWHRLNFVGLANEDGYDLPLTQIDLADTCGTTAIHMNRIIGQLRKQGLVEFRSGRVTIPDRHRLEEFAHFSPEYLYPKGELRSEKHG